MTAKVIPLFDVPLREFDECLEFYTALGFEMIYYQKAPYRYASMRKANLVEIGFYGNKDYSEEHPGGCYLEVADITAVYDELKTSLKSYYGKLPVKGKPRISRINQTAEDRRVNITDLAGNSIIIGEVLGDSSELMDKEEKRVKDLSSIERAYAQAYRYAYSKEDFLAASNLMNAAVNNAKDGLSAEFLFKAKVLLLECYLSLDLNDKAKAIVTDLEAFDVQALKDLDAVIERKNQLLEDFNLNL